MSELREGEVREYFDIQEKMMDRAEEILEEYCERYEEIIGNDNPPHLHVSFKELDESNIIYEGTETWRYGGREDHTVEFPLYWMWNPEWKKCIVDSIQEEKAKRNKVKTISQEEIAAQEKATALRLLEKYPELRDQKN